MTIFVTENSQAQCGTNASRRTPQATKHRVTLVTECSQAHSGTNAEENKNIFLNFVSTEK